MSNRELSHSIFKTFVLSICMVAIATFAHAQTAAILPNAKSTFLDSNGHPLTAGQVFFYIPGTTTPKTTWQDAAETIPNSNPVVLDGAGRALILGSGSYRQRVTDKNGSLIWDQVTSSAGGGGGGGTIGDGNAVGTILPWSGFAAPANYAFAYGEELSRTTYSVLFSTITQTQSVVCIGGSATLTTIADTSQLNIGAGVEAPCLPSGTALVSKTANTVTLNNTALVSATVSATFFPWGVGNGLTTFNVPDLRGVYLPGRCNMGGANCSILANPNYTDPNALGGIGGNQTATLALANIPPGIVSSGSNSILVNPAGNGSLFVPVSPGSGNISATSFTIATIGAGPVVPQTAAGTWSGVAAFTGTNNISVTSTGSAATSFANLPPSKTINYIIKIIPDSNIGTSSINQLAPGVPNELAGTDGTGIWGNVTVPTGLSVASSALNFNIPALTNQVSPNANNDFLILYNAATGTTQKATVGSVAASATAGVSSFNGLTGAVTGVSSLGAASGALDAPAIYGGNHTAVNADCENPMLLGGNVQFTITVNAVGTYTCNRFKLSNIDVYTGPGSGRGKLVTVSGMCPFWLMPGQSVELIKNAAGSAWITDKQLFAPDNGNALGPAINICYVERWKLPVATVLNVGGTGSSDTANDGLATGTGALATIQHALLTSCNAIDQQYQIYTVQVADGTYTTPTQLCNMVGYSTFGGHIELVLSGNTTTLGNTILSTTNSSVVTAVGLYTPWRIQGFKIQATGSLSNCIQADGHSFVYVGKNIFNGCPNAMLLASFDSMLETVDDFTIAGTYQYAFFAAYHSLVDTALAHVTLSGTPVFTNTFATAQNNSNLEAVSMTFTGSFTGIRFISFLGSAINTGTGNVNYFPGSVAGTVSCGSSTISGSVITSLGACGFYN